MCDKPNQVSARLWLLGEAMKGLLSFSGTLHSPEDMAKEARIRADAALAEHNKDAAATDGPSRER